MPKPDYALPNGATKYLNGCDLARKIITYLFTRPDWTKATDIRDLYSLTSGELISIARKLKTYELIDIKVVDTSNKSTSGKYWKLSPGYRYGIQHYLNRWNIQNGVEA